MTDLPCASANREISHRGGGYGREHGLSFGERRFVGLSFGHQHLAGFQYVCATPLFDENTANVKADPYTNAEGPGLLSALYHNYSGMQ